MDLLISETCFEIKAVDLLKKFYSKTRTNKINILIRSYLCNQNENGSEYKLSNDVSMPALQIYLIYIATKHINIFSLSLFNALKALDSQDI